MKEEAGTSAFWFTVQVAADLKPLDPGSFGGISPVEYKCKDGYYRYATGKFRSFEEARAHLDQMKRSGYPDAFIQTLVWYTGAVE